MNKAQLRHSKSIASHLLAHVYTLKNSMEAIEQFEQRDVTDYPVEKMEARFQQDVDYAIKKMNQVLADMLNALKDQ